MGERQKTRYVLTALNGMDIEAIGERNMRNLTNLLDDLNLKVRFIPKKKPVDRLSGKV